MVVNATIGKTTKLLNIYVVDDDLDTLCGREWIQHFACDINFADLFASYDRGGCSDVDIHNINSIVSHVCTLTTEEKTQLQQTIQRFEEAFAESAGKLTSPPVKVHMKPNAIPSFSRAREVPLALRDAYAREIDAKNAARVFESVEFSEWASTTHVVTKKNGMMRITGNYKPTVNPQMIIDEHPIPKAEDIFNKIQGATIFAYLDVTDAYTHLTIDDEFAHVLTLNTPTRQFGRRKWSR